METSTRMIKSAGARKASDAVDIGEKVYLRRNTAVVTPSAQGQ